MEAQKETRWLMARLRDVDKTPTELAQHLGVRPSEVYPVVYGRQPMPQEWIVPTAHFLELTVQMLVDGLGERER
jgi:plasmid maintenance system antidote protein VapI